MLERDVAANTAMRVHVDYADERHVDGMRVVPVAQLPALVLSGPDLPENRVYSTNEGHEQGAEGLGGPEVVRYRAPYTVDLEFQLTGSSNRTGELLNLMAAVGRFLNAVAESFFGSLKSELIDRQPWATRRRVIEALGEYIEVFYDSQRLHSTLGYRTPAEVERGWSQATQAA